MPYIYKKSQKNDITHSSHRRDITLSDRLAPLRWFARNNTSFSLSISLYTYTYTRFPYFLPHSPLIHHLSLPTSAGIRGLEKYVSYFIIYPLSYTHCPEWERKREIETIGEAMHLWKEHWYKAIHSSLIFDVQMLFLVIAITILRFIAAVVARFSIERTKKYPPFFCNCEI